MEWSNLKEHIGVTDDTENEHLQNVWNTAVSLVDLALLNAFRAVPEDVLNELYLEVGHELYNRKNAPSGNSQFAVFEGGSLPVRGPRDPLAQVRPIIGMYVCQF